jgi:hypothetical protein
MKPKVLKTKGAILMTMLVCISFWAQAETKVSKEHEACMDKIDFGAMKNSQMASCYSD